VGWFQRKHLIVDGELQYRFLAITLVHFFIILVVLITSIFFPLMLELDDMSLSFQERERIADQFLALHQRVWFPILTVLGLLTIHWAIFSHRIAGPLYRFRKVFQAIAEGKLSPHANLRKNDYLKQEAATLDDMITSLRNRIQNIKETKRDIQMAFNDLHRLLHTNSDAEMVQRLRNLNNQIERLQSCIDQFNTSPDPTTKEDSNGKGIVRTPITDFESGHR